MFNAVWPPMVGNKASGRSCWITRSTTYPLLDKSSATVADFVDRRRKGEPVFGGDEDEGEGNATK